MTLLATLIPLFDNSMNVPAYSIFAQRENLLANPGLLGTRSLDMASTVVGFEIVNNMGIDSLSNDSRVFVEVNNVSIYSRIEEACQATPSRVILLADKTIIPTDPYVARMKELKEKGFSLAIKGLAYTQFDDYAEILKLVDYIFLDHTRMNINVAKSFFSSRYPGLKLVAVDVNSRDDYESLTEKEGYALYEGEFFRVPVTSKGSDVSPLKANYIELMNIVNGPDFDLQDAADVISRDTALVISLLQMVNKMSRNSEITSVRHAAAMLGQKELKKWINAVVTKELCADRPSEVMRVSMLRAKFAEELAPAFEMAVNTQELFLVGLFSILDQILECPMPEALQKVRVDKDIQDALISRTGKYAKVLQFVLDYEWGDWQSISRQMIVDNLDMDEIYQAYVRSLRWFSDLLNV